MTSVPITWTNLQTDERVFAVFHREVPKDYITGVERTLVIPDRWGGLVSGRSLMSDEMRIATHYKGLGVAVLELPALDDGDIVLIDGERNRLEIIFSVKGNTNSLYVTNACNSKCEFCPQPSTADDGHLYRIAEKVIELVANPGECVNVTGGEPTIRHDNFIELMGAFSRKWSQTKAFVLTNGRLLSDYTYVDEIFSVIDTERIGFGIPLYSDAAISHDKTVGIEGAFGETVRGLYNLASKHAEIEIRFVLSKTTYKRLPQLVQYIGRNLPFVTRLAVMGIEPMGHCRVQWAEYWIDPEDARREIESAFATARNYGVDVLLYNFQLCCLPRELWKYACTSISEWKRVYIDECLHCPMKSECGGFFASQNKPQYRPRRFTT